MNVEVNFLAVLLAAVVNMAIGFSWYSPVMFAKRWMKLMGYTSESMKKDQKQMGKWYGLSFVVALITGYVLSHVMVLSEYFFHHTMLMTGLSTAFWMWFGFVMPVQLTTVIFSTNKNFELFAINTGYQLAAMLAMGVTIGLMM
jgi:hypothetical protein